MTDMDEESALAIVFANTRRKKRTEDLVTVATAFDHLVNMYGTQKAVAERTGLSSEMVREFRSVLKLPAKVKEMVRRRQIDRLDVAYHLARMRDPVKQMKMAQSAAAMQSKDIRDVGVLVRGTAMSVDRSKRKVLDSKLRGLNVFILDFEDEAYREIRARAKKEGVPPAELVKKAVLNWLHGQAGRRPKRK